MPRKYKLFIHAQYIYYKTFLNIAPFQIKSFHFSYPKLRYFFLPTKALVWCYTSADGCHHHKRGVACNCPRLCSLVSLSFWSRWLPLFVGSSVWVCQWLSLPPSLWSWCDFQFVAWSVMADLLKLDLSLFPAPCVFLIVHVVCILPVFVQSCFQ